jgi:YggT family protein
MVALLTLLSQIIELYIWVIIAAVILSWLQAFDVVNTRNRIVYSIAYALYRLTEPVYTQIRRVVPTLGGLDLSPIIVILGLSFLRRLMWELYL